ncbi:YeiH family protein [Sphingomonas humi]|uniref:YeiH family protein n=1 Tax=Sphingomonas humi TaxID=335630 RepID=A0ABP7S9E0_9SPHN
MNPLKLLPGVLLSVLVALAASLLGDAEAALFGRPWLEPLVLAILLGMVVGNAVKLPDSAEPGIQFSAKTVLDIAVALLGATLSWSAVRALGGELFLIIVLVVMAALGLVFLIGRALGLGPRLAMLIAAGNAICGNSAIAAVAPIIGAKREEVAAAIALTALIGVVTVIVLPFAVFGFGQDLPDYAVLTGLTVYAVPQVVAAAAPFGTAAIALATLVKLSRVVMLGPLTLLLALLAPRFAEEGTPGAGSGRAKLYLPWFIIAFALLAAARTTGWISGDLAATLGTISKQLSTVAMAALGLGVRFSSLRKAAPKVALTSALAAALMLVLAALSLLLV